MRAMTLILDCDSHLFESRTTWRDHIDPGMRDAALAIEDDELGWPWLTWRGQRLYPVESQVPGDAAIIGRERTRRADGNGRLLGVGHVTLADLDWLDDELDALAGAGIKLAMTAPAPVDGKRLSHPDLDRAWASFCDHDIAPVFHVGGFPSPFDPAWY